MNIKGSVLVDRRKFIDRIRMCRCWIVSFEDNSITNIDSETINRIWETITRLRISENNSQIVAASKTLHFLMPQLMPPIDRAYTRPFFSYHQNQFQNNEPTFKYSYTDDCLKSVYYTLGKFGMNIKGSVLVDRRKFIDRIRMCRCWIVSFEDNSITNIDSETINRIWETITRLRISENNSQIVAASKTLHFLMPQLMPPIDRAYTRPFFSYHQNQFQNNEPTFKFIMPRLVKIASGIDLSAYVGKSDWATSEAKVIDNAIVGFGIEHRRDLPKKVPECCSGAPSTASM